MFISLNTLVMKAHSAVAVTTFTVILFYILLNINANFLLTSLVYFSIPVLVVFMVYFVLSDDSGTYPELGKDEWGYRDKSKSRLGMF